MQSNVFLYIIIAAVLIGGLLGFMAYSQIDHAYMIEKNNVKKVTNNATRKKEMLDKEEEHKFKAIQRRKLSIIAMDMAKAIQDLEEQRSRKHDFEGFYKNNISRFGKKKEIYEKGTASLSDDLQTNIDTVEKSIKQVEEKASQDRVELERRQDELIKRRTRNKRKLKKDITELESKIVEIRHKIERENNIVAVEIKEPLPQGKVLDYMPDTNSVLINLGRALGIKKNLKFKVFYEKITGERIDKGFILIREVNALTSTGTLIIVNEDVPKPVKGDLIGSLVYKEGGQTVYLGGDYSREYTKYNKRQMAALVTYAGNRVVEELTPDVDIFISDQFAQRQKLEAAKLGIRVIPEEILSQYLGD